MKAKTNKSVNKEIIDPNQQTKQFIHKLLNGL